MENDNEFLLIKTLENIWERKIPSELPDTCINPPRVYILIYYPGNNIKEYYAVIKDDKKEPHVTLILGIKKIKSNVTQVFNVSKRYVKYNTDKEIYEAYPIPYDGTYKSPVMPIECHGRPVDSPGKYCLENILFNHPVLSEFLVIKSK